MLHSKFEFLFFMQMENIQKTADVRIRFLDSWGKKKSEFYRQTKFKI